MKYNAYVSVSTVYRPDPDGEPLKTEVKQEWIAVGTAETVKEGTIRVMLLTLPFDHNRWAGTVVLVPENQDVKA